MTYLRELENRRKTILETITTQGKLTSELEDLATDPDIRKWLRELALDRGSFVSHVRKKFKDSKTKFQMYYDYKEQVKTIPSHRMQDHRPL